MRRIPRPLSPQPLSMAAGVKIRALGSLLLLPVQYPLFWAKGPPPCQPSPSAWGVALAMEIRVGISVIVSDKMSNTSCGGGPRMVTSLQDTRRGIRPNDNILPVSTTLGSAIRDHLSAICDLPSQSGLAARRLRHGLPRDAAATARRASYGETHQALRILATEGARRRWDSGTPEPNKGRH